MLVNEEKWFIRSDLFVPKVIILSDWDVSKSKVSDEGDDGDEDEGRSLVAVVDGLGLVAAVRHTPTHSVIEYGTGNLEFLKELKLNFDLT